VDGVKWPPQGWILGLFFFVRFTTWILTPVIILPHGKILLQEVKSAVFFGAHRLLTEPCKTKVFQNTNVTRNGAYKQSPKFNGNSRILKWGYCTICLAIFWGYIPVYKGLKNRPYIWIHMVGTSNQSVPEISIEKWKVSTSTTIECPGMFKLWC